MYFINFLLAWTFSLPCSVFQTFHFFGFSSSMVHCAPESNCIDGLRLTFEGKRLVIIFNTKDFLSYADTCMPSDVVELQARCDLVLDRLDSASFTDVCKRGFGLHFVHVVLFVREFVYLTERRSLVR